MKCSAFLVKTYPKGRKNSIMVLTLKPEHLKIIRNHAQKTYPEECCGVLLGKINEGETQLFEVWTTDNLWNVESGEQLSGNGDWTKDLTKKRRYVVDPKEMLRAQKQGRDRGLNIIGFYHSHPDHPAVPSECDRQYAWQEYIYIIVSVPQGCPTDIYCWSLDEDHQFHSEQLRVSQKSE